ncbi:MAG: hypothetical protein ACREA0_08790 [bacterium]
MNIGTDRGHAHDRKAIEEPLPLSPERAFVVQFRCGSGPARFAGRVEHMPSARATHFASVEELLAFITRVLGEVRDEVR